MSRKKRTAEGAMKIRGVRVIEKKINFMLYLPEDLKYLSSPKEGDGSRSPPK